VNIEPRVSSQRSTHLGYCLSNPAELGEPQEALGLRSSPSFVVQVKNPLARVPGGQRVGLSPNRHANYPDWIINNIFGRGRGTGREDYGLRFAPVESIELLEYEGAELLLIAARAGEEGSETSLGEGRGDGKHTSLLRYVALRDSKTALRHVEKKEVKMVSTRY
jgi:hypothetical protein